MALRALGFEPKKEELKKLVCHGVIKTLGLWAAPRSDLDKSGSNHGQGMLDFK